MACRITGSRLKLVRAIGKLELETFPDRGPKSTVDIARQAFHTATTAFLAARISIKVEAKTELTLAPLDQAAKTPLEVLIILLAGIHLDLDLRQTGASHPPRSVVLIPCEVEDS